MKDISKLIKECIDNKKDAQEDFYGIYKDKLFGVCIRYSSSSAEAEDLLQETFYTIFKNLKKSMDYDNIYTWMRKIAINKCINHYHKNKKHYENRIDTEEISMMANNEAEMIEGKFEADFLLSLINSLPEGYRMVFNLYTIDGYSHREISKHLGISESTSKSQLFKAKKNLKSLLKTHYAMSYEKSV